MKAVLTGTQALHIEDANDWNEALAVFKQVLGIDPNPNRWERKRNEKINEIKALTQKQPNPPLVPIRKLQEAEAKLKGANEEIAGLENENARLKKLLSDLKKAKDAKEATRIELESLPVNKQFESLVRGAVKALKPLPKIVREALFYRFRHELLPWAGFGEDARKEEIAHALEREFLSDAGSGGVQVNDNAPKLRRAIEVLSELQSFVDEATPEFIAAYEAEKDEELSFTSRSFWEKEQLL